MRLPRVLTAAVLLAGSALLASAGPAAASPNDTVYGVTNDSRLVLFSRSNPQAPFQKNTQIAGFMTTTEKIVGIDVRSTDRKLYAVTRSPSGQSDFGTARVYTIATDPSAPTFARATLVSMPSVLLKAGDYDVDFDPCSGPPDSMRLVGTDASNYRLTGPTLSTVVTDTPLSYASGDANAGITPRVGGVAYTQGSAPAGAGCTAQLYGIDYNKDVLVRQGATTPNDGQLTTIGALGRDVNSLIGFDTASDGTAYVAAQATDSQGTVGQATEFFTINLATGQLTSEGPVGSEVLQSIALAPDGVDLGPTPVVPEVPAAAALPALGAAAVGGVLVLRRRRVGA